MEDGPILEGDDFIPQWDDDFSSGCLVESVVTDGQKSLIEKALKETGGNKSRAARMLGISRKTLYVKLEKYGLA